MGLDIVAAPETAVVDPPASAQEAPSVGEPAPEAPDLVVPVSSGNVARTFQLPSSDTTTVA